MNGYITERLRDRIKGQVGQIEDAILHGKAKSFDDYRYMVGRLDGLNIALRELSEVESEPEDED